MREGGTGVRVSGLAQAQLFSSDRVCKPRVAQPPVIQEGFSGVPSGSDGYVGGRGHVWMMMKMSLMMMMIWIIGISCGGSGGSVFCTVG